jgi:hypothetical protein
MTEGENEVSPSKGDRRGANRRNNDRRRLDRRLPAPWWRRPPVLVSIGAVGMLLLVLMTGVLQSRDPQQPRTDEALLTDTARVQPEVLPHVGPAEDALTSADFDRLMAEGETAIGRLVRVELYCNAINQTSVRNMESAPASLQVMVDVGSTKVPAAECRWGPRNPDVRRDDLMLVVPTDMAEAFAQRPVVEDGFVRRRQVHAEIEWLGRSEALALRPAGILRELH